MGILLLVIAWTFANGVAKGHGALALILLYVATFGCTLGAVTWVYLSEIFPNRIRATALSLSTLALWLADFIVAYTFPVMNTSWGTHVTLLCYAGCCAASFFFVLAKVPETKGRRLEEIEILFAVESRG
jgi:SP family arabinose:H+ symporter-like MFS transporter